MKRFAWLATALLFVACASAPEPVATKKKKKKRKSDRTALKKKKKQKSQADQEAKEEQPDKPEKGAVVVTDDDEDEDTKEAAAKKRKKETEREAEEEAARKKEEEAQAEKEAAAEKKRKKEEAAEAAAEKKRKKEEEAEAEEEAAAEKKRKKEEEAEAEKEAAAERKRKKDKKKDVEAEEASFDASEQPEQEKPKQKDKVAAKTEPEPAEVDMSGGDVIEMPGDEAEEAPAGRRVAAIAVPGVDSDEVEEVEEAAPQPDGVTPRSINDRPLTLGKDKISVHGGLRVGVITLPNLQNQPVSTTTQSFALGGTYGLDDKLEVGGDYTLGLSPGSIKGPLTLHAAYRASASRKLDVAIGAALSVDFYSTTDPVTMLSTSHTLASFGLGAWARYRIDRKLSLFTGLPALPDSTVALSKTTIPLPPLPYHLAIGLNGGGAIAFDAPVGVGYQLTPKLYTFADVDLAHIRIKNTANRFLFKDFIPIQLGAFYALSKLDIGAQFSDDLEQGFDFLRFDILLRYSIK